MNQNYEDYEAKFSQAGEVFKWELTYSKDDFVYSTSGANSDEQDAKNAAALAMYEHANPPEVELYTLDGESLMQSASAEIDEKIEEIEETRQSKTEEPIGEK